MVFRCNECGHLFEEGEQVEWVETHGLNSPPYEAWSGCPICKGDYVETEECEICGGHYLSEDLSGGVCRDCIDKHRNDYELCELINNGEKVNVKIDAFLATQFTIDEINELLKFHLHFKARSCNIDCSEFIDNDISWFAEELVKNINN